MLLRGREARAGHRPSRARRRLREPWVFFLHRGHLGVSSGRWALCVVFFRPQAPHVRTGVRQTADLSLPRNLGPAIMGDRRGARSDERAAPWFGLRPPGVAALNRWPSYFLAPTATRLPSGALEVLGDVEVRAPSLPAPRSERTQDLPRQDKERPGEPYEIREQVHGDASNRSAAPPASGSRLPGTIVPYEVTYLMIYETMFESTPGQPDASRAPGWPCAPMRPPVPSLR